jgi:hypothetical protein
MPARSFFEALTLWGPGGRARTLARVWLWGLGGLWGLGAGCGVSAGTADCLSEPSLCPRGTECDPDSRKCRPIGSMSCSESAGCPLPEKPICSAGRCVACDALSDPEQSDAACQARGDKNSQGCIRSGARKGRCGACRVSAHCTDPARPVCDTATSSCRPCQRHAECPASMVCNLGGGLLGDAEGEAPEGHCVPASKTVLVDGDRCVRGDPASDGSSERPFCDPQSALGKGAILVVKPRAVGSYPALALSGGRRVVLVGPGREVGATPHLAGVSASGDGTSLVVSDLRLRGDTAAAACTGGASLALLRSLLGDSPTGVDATGCGKLTIEGSEIRGSRGTGLRIGPGARSYRVVNTLVRDNGTAQLGAVGVYLAQGPSGSFAFNTLLGNGPQGPLAAMASDGGGVTCEAGGAPRPVTDSIIVQNSRGPGATGTQFSGPCTLQRVVVGIDAVSAFPPSTSVLRILPDLDQSLRLLNTPNNRMYVVDKGQADAVQPLRVDHFGGERPKGAGYDLGAHELR